MSEFGADYATGTVNVTNGSATVTGSGVIWNDVEKYDWFWLGGSFGIVSSVNGTFDQITLVDNWTGSTVTGSVYRIYKASPLRYDPALTQQKLRQYLADVDAAGNFNFVSGSAPDPSTGEDGQFAIKVNATPWTVWYKTGGTWVLQGVAAGGNAYDVAGFTPGKFSAGLVLHTLLFDRTVTFGAGLTGSVAYAGLPASASAVCSIKKNGSQVGTLTFAIGANVGTFVMASTQTFGSGDLLDIVGPTPADASLGDIRITLQGIRN